MKAPHIHLAFRYFDDLAGRFAVTSLEASLKDHFLSVLSLDEVFQIAVDEWQAILKQLEKFRLFTKLLSIKQEKINEGIFRISFRMESW